MPTIPVNFEYRTGLRHIDLRNARLTGSWDGDGRPTEQWSTVPMQAFAAEDGCPAFRATAMLDDGQIGRTFRWSVIVDTPAQASVSGIPTEVNDAASTDRYRVFTLAHADQTERYYLTHCRRLGANKLFEPGRDAPAVRFAVWAPNAQNVELVRSRLTGENNSEGGYIWDDGRGVSAVIPMHRDQDGVWSTDLADSPDLADFRAVRPHALHVPHHQGRRFGCLPHRPLLALPDRERRRRSGSRGMERTPTGSGRHQELLRDRRSRAGDGRVQLTGVS